MLKRLFLNTIPDMGQPSDIIATARAFVALEFLGGLGMSILLCTAFFSHAIQRRRTWYSFCISWVISSFSYCLSFFAGQQFNFDEQPGYGVCLTQAVLIYAGPPLTAATTLALLLDVWWIFRVAMSRNSRNGHIVMRYLIVLPYLLWIVLVIGHFTYGALNPSTVQRNLRIDPYCTIQNPVPPILASTLTVSFACLILVMLGILTFHMKKARIQMPAATRSAQNNANAQLKSLILRLIVFSFLTLIAVVYFCLREFIVLSLATDCFHRRIGVVFTFNRAAGLKYDLALAIIPPTGVVIFGTQRDLLQEWAKLFRWLYQPLRRMRKFSSEKSQNSTQAKAAGPDKDLHSTEIEREPQDAFATIMTHDDEVVLVSPRRVHGMA